MSERSNLESWMPCVLLTGAGFSRNWGGWLAIEAFEYLLGCPEWTETSGKCYGERGPAVADLRIPWLICRLSMNAIIRLKRKRGFEISRLH